MRRICPNCGALNSLVMIEGRKVCRECGIVLEEHTIDWGPEWRFLDPGLESRARTGSALKPSKPAYGLTSHIDWSGKDSSGTSLMGHQFRTTQAIRRMHLKITSSLDRRFSDVINCVERYVSGLKLPGSIRDTAALLFRRYSKGRTLRGKTIDGVAAALVYLACRIHRETVTMQEVLEISGVSKKDFNKAFNEIVSILKKEYSLGNRKTASSHFVDKIVYKLKMSNKTKMLVILTAKKLLKEFEKSGFASGKGPQGLAAGAVYAACIINNVHITQKDIADAAGVTEVTVRNRYKDLIRRLHIDIMI